MGALSNQLAEPSCEGFAVAYLHALYRQSPHQTLVSHSLL